MSRDSDFLNRWNIEQPIYNALGEFIVREVVERVAEITAVPPSVFFKVPPTFRTKEGESLLEKAFYRKKDYPNPYDDITDKVGTRFVPLLGRDLEHIELALKSIPDLDVSKDRDFQEEQRQNPIAFDYAAKHFVVRPMKELVTPEATVPEGTPCEVQIKSVLQHAYSEMSHDTIYKSQIERTTDMQRNAAKAMALLEATNDYFEKVDDEVREALRSVREMTSDLSSLYRELTMISPKATKLEGILLEQYEKLAGPNFEADVREMFGKKGFLPDAIRKRVEERNPIFQQPSVLLVYLDIHRRKERAKYDWPLTPAEMEPLLNDFGQSVEN